MPENEYYVHRRRDHRAVFNDKDITLQCYSKNYSFNNFAGENLSVNGICVESTNSTPQVGDFVGVSFNILGGARKKTVHARAKIKWKKNVSSFGSLSVRYHLGLEFENLDASSEKIISDAIRAKHFSVAQQKEYDSLRKEIGCCQNNLQTIILSVVSICVTIIGTSMIIKDAKLPFLFALPLLVIWLGFHLYKYQLERMRRNASYLRCFIEPAHKDLHWEESLYVFRRTQNIEDKKLDYYQTSVFLSILCFAVGAFNVFYFFKSSEADFIHNSYWTKYAVLALYGVLALGWFSYWLPKIKKHFRRHTGADVVETRFFDIWESVKRYKSGYCSDLDHFRALSDVIYGERECSSLKGIKKLIKHDKGLCSSSAPHCVANKYLRVIRIVFYLMYKNGKSINFKIDKLGMLWQSIFFINVFIGLALTVYGLYIKHVMSADVDLSFAYFLSLLLLATTTFKVDIKQKYIPMIIRDDKVSFFDIRLFKSEIKKRDEILSNYFPKPNSLETKSVPVFSWMFYYSLLKGCTRDRRVLRLWGFKLPSLSRKKRKNSFNYLFEKK